MHKGIIFHFRNRDWLYGKYIKEGYTCKQIAELCNCHHRTINQRLVMFNIPRRHGVHASENLQKWREQNPNWAEHTRKKRKPLSTETKRKLSLIRRGSGSANWKGGITAKIRGIRRSPEYYQWRKAILEKDDSICQKCGSAENPQAHHKLCVMDFPNKIFDIENGEVLCQSCHKKLNLSLKEVPLSKLF